VPLGWCVIKKRNGRSALNTIGSSWGPGIEVTITVTAVAAAASVPSSSTATKALCTTASMTRSCVPARPEKLARTGVKADGMPRRLLDPEPGQVHLDPLHGQVPAGGQLQERLRRQLRFQLAEAVVGAGQDHDHGQVLAPVGQPQDLGAVDLAVAEAVGLPHQRGLDGRAGGQVERRRTGGGLVEARLPAALEVDRVAEDQPGGGGHGAGGEQVLDPLPGLVADPAVDAQAGGFRLSLEVDAERLGLVVASGGVEKLCAQREILLEPEGVGDGQLERRLVVGLVAAHAGSTGAGRVRGPLRLGGGWAGELPHQRAELLVVVAAGEEHLLHLLLGAAAGAEQGHAQGAGDAVGREEEVAAAGGDLAVEVPGEPGVGLLEGHGRR